MYAVRCLLAIVGLLAMAPAASATEVTHGTIMVGRGAAGARLDMTRSQVVAKLGTPEAENDNGVLFYESETSSHIFDVYRELAPPNRVRMFVIAGFRGGAWKLADGNAIFARHAIDRLYRHYHKRVHRRYDPVTGERSYVIKTRYHHRRVETSFQVDRFGRKRARVLDAFILFTDP
jgi:hypothetical protein